MCVEMKEESALWVDVVVYKNGELVYCDVMKIEGEIDEEVTKRLSSLLPSRPPDDEYVGEKGYKTLVWFKEKIECAFKAIY